MQGAATAAPVVGSGCVLVTTFVNGRHQTNWLYALRTSSGSLMWSMGGRGVGLSSPVIIGGIVCTASGTGEVYAVRVNDGGTIWDYSAVSANAVGDQNPILAADGGICYVAATDLTALRAADGAKLWSFPGGSPKPVAGIVYAAGYDGSVYALSAHQGTQIWKSVRLPGSATIQAVAEGALYASSGDHVYALRPSDGALLWSFSAGGNELTGVIADAGTVFVGTGINDNGTLAADTPNGYLYALRSGDGVLLWRFPAKGGVYSVAASGQAVYFNTADGHVRALRADGGSGMWSFALGGSPGSNSLAGPVAVGSEVFFSVGKYTTENGTGIQVTDPGGHVYALSASGGETVWDFRTGSIPGLPTVETLLANSRCLGAVLGMASASMARAQFRANRALDRAWVEIVCRRSRRVPVLAELPP